MEFSYKERYKKGIVKRFLSFLRAVKKKYLTARFLLCMIDKVLKVSIVWERFRTWNGSSNREYYMIFMVRS